MNGYFNGKRISLGPPEDAHSGDGDSSSPGISPVPSPVPGNMNSSIPGAFPMGRSIPPIPPPHAGPPKRKPVRRIPVSVDSHPGGVAAGSGTGPITATQRNSMYEGLAPSRSSGSNNSSNSAYQTSFTAASTRPLSGPPGSVPLPPGPIPYLDQGVSDNISPKTSSSNLSNAPSPAFRSYSPSPSFYNSEENNYSNERISGTVASASASTTGPATATTTAGTVHRYQAQPQVLEGSATALYQSPSQMYAQTQARLQSQQNQNQSQNQHPQQQYHQQQQPGQGFNQGQAIYQSHPTSQSQDYQAYQTQSPSNLQYNYTNPDHSSGPSSPEYVQATAESVPQPPIPHSSANAYPYSYPYPSQSQSKPSLTQQLPPVLVPTNNAYDSDNTSPVSRSSQQFSHRRSGSTHSASSGASFSQPLYISASSNSAAAAAAAVVAANQGTGGMLRNNAANFANPYSSQTSLQQSISNHSRGNSISSRVSNNGTSTGTSNTTNTISPAVSSATRSATTASSTSGGGASAASAAPVKQEIPGLGVVSAYVRQLRVNSASAWSDKPASVWGLPIGISTNANGSALYKPTPTYAKSLLRRTVDPRHSHLTPRLLASEIDDEDDDMPMVRSQASSQTLGHSPQPSNATSDSILTATGTSTTPSSGSGSGPASSSYKYNPSLAQQHEESASIKSSDANTPYGGLSRAQSVSSTKSVEEDIGKIRLFVANPDDS
ncbi:hypothetical protein AWJ20_347 [Sugiyamaella lignohabitans]|uniref:Uncharacterized protein n=1 Tax=Sugiyamaella lignohabitans TaxID=796027 RepID=A0A167CU58_9ASCO|nr:uncharacterized protein AWJ20_347 [Sugiyamaella lignohabitans]ANB12110.1 hypothetical protein AWJ20_347 [Sugiyamaella lignohabitans]